MPKKDAAIESKGVTMRVRVGDAEIEVSGPPAFVKAEIKEFLERTPAPTNSVVTPVASAAGAEQKSKPKSPAQFFKMSNPRSDVDRTLVGAYFLEKYRDVQNESASEIRDVIKEAKVPPPRNINDSVNQNIRKGLMMMAGDREKKMVFVVTTDGEAAVEQMMGSAKN
jgi:hypothetical protein